MKNKPADIPYGGLNPQRIRSAKPEYRPGRKEMFREYVFERYKIHVKKDVWEMPAPWTDDLILRTYSFTNVRREHDKTTKHLISWLEKHKNASFYDKVLNIVLYRLFNKIETMEKIGWIEWRNFNPHKIRTRLLDVPEGYIYFSNAFLASGMKKEMNKKYPEEKFRPMNIPMVINDYKEVLPLLIVSASNPMSVIEALKTLPGVSNFLAYQIFVDLTYLPEFPWSENEFTVSGPGCEKGLSELFSHRDGLSPEELLFWLRDNPPFTQEELNNLMVDLPKYDRKMNVMSLENCMCEFSKYIRAKQGTGRPRSKYKYREE